MKIFDSTLFRLSLATLLLLLLLRLLGGNPPQTPETLWMLSFVWPFLMGYALALDRGVSLSTGSPWGALVVITSLMAGMLTVGAMGLLGQAKIDAFLVGWFGIVLAVLCVGWWRLLRPKKRYSAEAVARPWLYIILGIVAAIGVVLNKMGLISV